MTPLDYLNSVIEEYKTIKEELIPIDYVTNESENNLVFFQDKKLKELEDNQTVSYYNIGEVLEKVIKEILNYSNDLKNVDAVSLDSDIKKQFLILNSLHYADNNINIIKKDATAYSLFSYKDISEVKSFIDQINISNYFNVFSKSKNREVSIEPVLYYIDVANNIVNKFIINDSFAPTSIWGAIFIGIKFKEKIDKYDVLSINSKYQLQIRYNDFNYKNYSIELINQNGLTVSNDIKDGEVPIFNIVDLFGNDIKIRTVDGLLLSVSKDETINKTFDKKILSNIQINSVIVPFSRWENISLINSWSYGRKPEQITFNVCKTNDFSNSLYFPALTPLANNIKEIINEL